MSNISHMNNIKLRKDGFYNESIVLVPNNLIHELGNPPLLLNTQITDIGYFPNAINYYVERKKGVNEFILIFCLSGQGFVSIENHTYELNENNIIIIPLNISHSYGSKGNNGWEILWIHFKGEYIKYYYSNLYSNNIIFLSKEDKIKSSNVFFEALHILECGLIRNHLLHATQCINYFLSIMFNNTISKSSNLINSNTKYIDKAILYMLENLNTILTLDDISSVIGISKSHTTLLFKEETNRSPIDYFIRLKIQKSCSLLKYSNMSIKNIALKYGYTDQYYFSRIFKKVVGMSPKSYRVYINKDI